MRSNRFSTKWIVSLALLGAAATTAAATAGCGGGGGGGGNKNPGGGGGNNNLSFSGTLTDQAGDLIPGDTVSFDGNSSYTAVTSSSGTFTVKNVPTSVLTGSDYLAVTDVNGTEVATYSLSGVTTSQTNIVITIGPPAPPSSLVITK